MNFLAEAEARVGRPT